MEHQRLLSLKQVEESTTQNSEKMKTLSSDQQSELKNVRSQLVQSDMEAWKFLLEFHRISDQDIKEILCWNGAGCNVGNPASVGHTESSDDARRAILKIYSYETPLYRELNMVNMSKDYTAIPTLGPF